MLRSTWENMSKMLGQASAGMPIPLSRTETHDLVAAPLGGRARCGPRLRVLGAVGEQVAEDLGQPGQVGVEEDRLGRQRDGQLVPGRLDGGRAVSTALLTTSASGTRERRSSILLRLIRETSSRSSMSRTMCPSWRSIMARACATAFSVAAGEPHHLQAVAERGERVAQLVGQQGEELVLLAVGLPEVLLGPPARVMSRKLQTRPTFTPPTT